MRSDLKRRYGEERVPRYTSYPPPPVFSEKISNDTYASWLESVAVHSTASVYVHVPFCRSMCWYCGCNTTVSRHDSPIFAYLTLLEREIELVAERLPQVSLTHLHFGGGTPSIIAPNKLRDLVERLTARLPLAAEAEVAIEIDPRTFTPAMAFALGEAGFNRASLGVQTFDPAVQAAINRGQTFEQTARATEELREAGVRRINFDLIYGLPHQTIASCIDTVRMCLSLRPDRFAVFGYAHVPSFKRHQQRIDERALPNVPIRNAQAEAIAHVLAEAGYQQIGLDHYALPDDPLVQVHLDGLLHRNFQGYTTDRSDILIGFGASAIGRLPQGYLQNAIENRAYADRITAGQLATVKGYELTKDDRLRGEIIERLMCYFVVDLGQICANHGVSLERLIETTPRLEMLERHGLVRLRDGLLEVTPDARFLVRAVASAFDVHFAASSRPGSRAI